MLWSSFLPQQALTGSLQNSCSKELFGKIPRKACECTLGLHPGCFFLEHQWTPLDGWIRNRRNISICRKVVLMPWLSTRKHKYSIFRKNSEGKNFFRNADSNNDADAEMPRFAYGLDKNTFWWLLPDNWIESKFLHPEALKNLINRNSSLDYWS